MKTMKDSKLATIMVLVLFCCLVMFSAVPADDDEHEEDERATPVVPASMQPVLDSLYASIDSGFQRLEPTFKKSCFDCHTDQTDFPWYHSLPGIGGMMDDHIKEGREHLDMTKGFPFAGKMPDRESLKEMREEIEEGGMPIWSYRLMHWGTLIEGESQDAVFSWIDSSLKSLDNFYESMTLPTDDTMEDDTQ